MTTRREVAIHEAGHAVYGLSVAGLPVEFASINPDPRQGTLGMVKYMQGGYRLADVKRLVTATLAGPVAESIDSGKPLRIREGAGSDGAEIDRLLAAGGHAPREARAIAARWVPEVYSAMLQPRVWGRVLFIAEQLLRVGRLDGATLQALLAD